MRRPLRKLVRTAPWWVAASFVACLAPRFVTRLFALDHGAGGAIALVQFAHFAIATAAALATLALRPRREPHPKRGAWMVALGLLALMVVSTVWPPSSSLQAVVEHLETLLTMNGGLAPIAAGLFVLGDTARRRALSDRDFSVRVATATAVLVLVPISALAYGRGFSWACFDAPLPAERSAYAAIDQLRPCLGAHTSALLGVLASVVLRARARPAAALPLWGLVSWLAGTAASDALALSAAEAVAQGGVDAPIDAAALERLAWWANATGGVATALALAVWTLVAGVGGARLSRSPVTIAWRPLAPLVPVLFLATSAAADAPLRFRFPQQLPHAVWNDVPDFQPLTRPGREGATYFFSIDDADTLTALLRPRFQLTTYLNGRMSEGHTWDLFVPPHDRFWSSSINVLPDQRSTFGDLRASLRAFRRFPYLDLYWRAEALDAAPLARRRWAFAEMGGRALRSRHFVLAETPDDCGTEGPALPVGVHGQWCEPPQEEDRHRDEPMLVADEPDERPIREWLEALDAVHATIALDVDRTVRPVEQDAHDPRLPVPHDEIDRRLAARDPIVSFVLGIAAGLALLLATLAARAIAPSSRWLRWLRIAPSRSTAEVHGPYRTSASPPTAQPIRAAVARPLARATRASVQWWRDWSFVIGLAAAATSIATLAAR